MPSSFDNFGGEIHSHHRAVEHSQADRSLSPAERLAVLETKFDQMKEDHNVIMTKLDDLLELKHKGLGAVWFISLIVGAGITAAIGTIISLVKGHV